MTSISMLDAALGYAARGWPVLPLFEAEEDPAVAGKMRCACGVANCKEIGKRPRIIGGDDFENASTDPSQIREWWARWPKANIGIVTGKASGLFIVDVDPRNGGLETLAELQRKYGNLPSTLTASTGGGGLHIIFRRPDGSWRWKKKLGRGIDIKSDGGYVVAAPSLHGSGMRYAGHDGATEIAFAPDWLLNEARKAPVAPRHPLESIDFSRAAQGMDANATRRYAVAALTKEAQAVAHAKEGTRNDTLNQAAFSMGTLVGAGAIDREEVEEKLSDAARQAGLEEDEIESTIESGLSAGEQHPRQLPISVTMEKRTDCGNAERFARLSGDRIRYVASRKQWLVWKGQKWEWDRTGKATRQALKVIRSIYSDAAQIDDADLRKKWIDHAQRSEAAPRINAMLDVAKSIRPLPLRQDELDSDPWLFNCENGTVDLRTGEFQAHRPENLITKIAPVKFDPKATCPKWEEFLARILPSHELRMFVQRAAGYALTGLTDEHAMFILHGNGANGKTTFVETLRTLIGDYAGTAAPTTFLVRQNERQQSDIAVLVGARFVTAAEIESGGRLAESLVKQITGGDSMTGRHLYCDPFEFKPTFKIFMSTNYLPVINGTDTGIWRRIRQIPFKVTILEEERDPNLLGKLRAELSGILNWALQGCAEWQRKGLGHCAEVDAATNEYREEMDPLADFFTERCELDKEAKTASRDLYQAYKGWCFVRSRSLLSERQFYDLLPGKGLTQAKIQGKARGWRGLKLKSSETASQAVSGADNMGFGLGRSTVQSASGAEPHEASKFSSHN